MPLLAGLGPLGVPELLIIAFIIILIFGVGRIPEVGGALGKGIREFRKSTKDDADAVDPPAMASTSVGASPASTLSGMPTAQHSGSIDDLPTARSSADGAAAPDSRFCSECGTKNDRMAKFCAECGHTMSAVAL